MSIDELKARVRAKVLAVTNAKSDHDLPVGLTTAQAAAVLNRSHKTLLNWSSAGTPIAPMRDAQGRLLWPIDKVEAILLVGGTDGR